jgi:hypothetical protein
LKEMDRDSLATICVMFPGLQDLRLDASFYTDPQGLSCVYIFEQNANAYRWLGSSFLDHFCALPLPQTIVSLSIDWCDSGQINAPRLVAAKDSLLLRLPYLRRLWLCVLDGSAIIWSRTRSGQEQLMMHGQLLSPSSFTFDCRSTPYITR